MPKTPAPKRYPEVNSNPDFPKIEASILKFWDEQHLFKRSISARPAHKGAHSNEFIFYDGPPFANGLPHYGHLLTGYVKDLFARFQTMKGKRVERRFGWDCHGLPAEMGSEKELGISGRQAIMAYGIDKFNAHCERSVMVYTQEWRDYVTRQARWVDFDDDYKTMDITFMESVLWAFKQLFNKGLVYEAYRVMPYSWAAETPLSNFETRLDNSTREREDKAITVAFELKHVPDLISGYVAGTNKKPDKYFILAWTTTPWTLPSNLALAVNKEVRYDLIFKENSCYILSASAKQNAFKQKLAKDPAWENFEFDWERKDFGPCGGFQFSGENLLGLHYEPLFPYFAEHANAFQILDGSDFVTDTDGTGIVHIAPGFGEEDQRVAEANGIKLVCPVDHAGRYTDEIYDLLGLSLKGLNVIAENVEQHKFGEANDRIIAWLKLHGPLIKQETIKHNYPHCWRTDTPLIYRAVPSWYVEVTKFKDRMVELNQQINWIPGHVKDGLFGKWLENARDWSISRNRFWGTPIPVWRSDNPRNNELYVFGSIKELEQFFGAKIDNLHRPYIDELTKPDPHDSRYTLRRVEDVFDCWFESGSMPYGQVHYPFQNKEWFEQHFPADFIVEYQAQTRGWFYTLMVLSTALFDRPPFLNCICHGVVLDDKGQKLSKRLNNYVDPNKLFAEYGADALRWFMMSSPVMRGAELYIDPKGKFIRDVVRLSIKPIWNAYNFFCLYANADHMKAKLLYTMNNGFDSWHVPHHPLDRYILSKLAVAVRAIDQAFERYDTPAACDTISQFFESLNNWYIRRSKPRFWKEERDADKQDAYDTLYTVLHVMLRVAAPLLPLVTEEMYLGLTIAGKREAEASIHLADFPNTPNLSHIYDEQIARDMDRVKDICNAALAVRNGQNLRVRLPLARLTVIANDYSFPKEFTEIIKDEVNVKEVVAEHDFDRFASLKLQVNFPRVGARLGAEMKTVIAAVKSGQWQKGKNNTIEVAGNVLHADEYSLLLEAKPEIKNQAAPLASNDALVMLDTHVTEALEQEGIARDLVRLIQQARKDADLNVSARIHLRIDASAPVTKALKTYRSYIMEQTLTSELDDKLTKPEHQLHYTLDEEKVDIAFSIAA